MRTTLTALVVAGVCAASAVEASAPAPYLEALTQRVREGRLATDERWLRLGHYRQTLTGGWKSQADGVAFFVAANGKNDPEEELLATLRAFFDPPQDDQHALCRFPARFELLDSALSFDRARLPEVRCEKRDAFVERVGARSVTFSFSTYYFGNPGSVFGHTFLRLNKDEKTRDGKAKDLLDWGINFAAEAGDSTSVAYVIRGLTGGFRGSFAHLPYFYKVREYNDYESRDLWEYRLALKDEEVRRLVLHLWELGGTYFDYYYVDENCSYHLLSALEAAAPRLRLVERLRVYALPSDAVKALAASEGLVSDVRYRPSLRAQFEWRTRGLSAQALEKVRLLEADPRLPLDGSDEAESARVLDAAMDYLDLVNAKALVRDPPEALTARRHKLLVRRAKLGLPSTEFPSEPPLHEAPHRAHASVRLGMGGGAGPAGTFAQVTFRGLLHDLADRPTGYPEHTQLELLPFTLRYELGERQVRLEEAQLLRVANLAPVSRFSKRAAWNLQLGARTVRDGGCDSCVAGGLETGVGVAVEPFDAPLLLYAFANAQLEAGPSLNGLYGSVVRPSAGPELGARWHAGERYSTHLSAGLRVHGEQTVRSSWHADWIHRLHVSDSFSVDVRARRFEHGMELAATALSYF